ncbi:hypothetical protein [Yoonia sp.]|uniref:hypothetical protein n=1 Tax=Yoonia sp. TaxID=2212373 RepID=UPI0019F64BE2|nr:hypothetical protein [Yoonia sp.]MBE0413226.1 hypothetical protein [Yoonia sp.]
MTINFALSLSFEGIDLLVRVPGGWRLIGTASLDDPDLGTALARMREQAQGLADGPLRSKIVIPLEQIKCLAIDSTQTDLTDIHAILDGTTPYRLDELVIDYERSGGRTHIAAVARETLSEAENFAMDHGFNPVCFVAVPEPFTFQTEIFFGPTSMMHDLLGTDATVTRDPLPVLVAGTSIKSRMLVLHADNGAADLDLTALLARGAGDRPEETDAQASNQQTAKARCGDVFMSDLSADSTGAHKAMQSSDATATIRADAIVAEYYPHRPEAINRLQRPAKSTTRVDRIIPEYCPMLRTTTAHILTATPPPAATPKTRNFAAPSGQSRRAPVASSHRRLIAGSAVAAGVLLIFGLIWAQDKFPDTATRGISAQQADNLTDAAPLPPLQTITASPRPSLPDLALAAPRAIDAPITPTPQGGADVPTADALRVDMPPANTPLGQVLSPDQAAGIYAATGVWQRAPRFASVPRATSEISVTPPAPLPAAGRITQPATVALPLDETDMSFLPPADPPPADVRFTIDENGFVQATPEGTLTPEGAIVFAGLPDIQLRLRPERAETAPAETATPAEETNGVVVIAGAPSVQPPLRPDEIAPSISPGGVALTQLEPATADVTESSQLAPVTASLRPRLRPASIASAVASATAPANPDITAVISEIERDSAARAFIDMTPRAVGASKRPEARPRNFDRVVAVAQSRPQPAAAPDRSAPDTNAPIDEAPPELTLPPTTTAIPGGVARAATQENVISLRDMNLIGVYGRSNARRALVRLNNGRYVRVEVGSTLDGGQVTAISEKSLNFVKRGRTYALELPSG